MGATSSTTPEKAWAKTGRDAARQNRAVDLVLTGDAAADAHILAGYRQEKRAGGCRALRAEASVFRATRATGTR